MNLYKLRVAYCRVLLPIILLLALPRGAFASSGDFQFGVGAHLGLNWHAYPQVANAMPKIGATSFRDEVFWHRLETEKGKFRFPDSLKELDRIVTEAKSRGIRPLLILNYGNKFYDDGDLISSDEGVEAYLRYVKFVVTYFKGRVDQYEIWNEWNIGMGSTKKPRTLSTPEMYVKILKGARAVIKQVDPNVVVVGGGVEGLDKNWIFRFGMAGGFGYLDVFSIHPYVHNRGQIGTPEYVFNWLDQMKRQIDGFSPKREIPIYITEIGWPTNAGTYGISETLASAYYERFMLLAKSRPWIAGVWWYDLIDDGPNATDKEHRFGMFRQNLKPKPVAESAMRLTPLLKDIVSATSKTDADKVVNWVGKTTAGKTVTARWLNGYDEAASVTPASNGRSLMVEPIGIQPKIEVSR